MGRPKKISDSELLSRAFAVISNEGFESFTLEQVSKKTGLSPAALIKRFKTKKRLANMARDHKWDLNLGEMQLTESDRPQGLKGIFHFVKLIALSVDSKKLGEHLRMLGTDADDFRFKKKLGRYFQTTRNILSLHLSEAQKMGELSKNFKPEAFAKTMEALIQGSIFQYAFLEQREPIESHLRMQITTLIKPYQ